MRYMLPVALEYFAGDCNGFRVYRPARGGRSCKHFGGHKTINRIPLFPLQVHRTAVFQVIVMVWTMM